jgi:hypothetical protein
MATYKTQFLASGLYLNQIISELTAKTGIAGFGYTLSADNVLTVEMPDNVNGDIVNAVINGHRPNDSLSVMPPTLLGAANTVLGSQGIQANLPLLNAAINNVVAGTIVDQRLGVGDPYDANNPFSGVWIVYPAVAYPPGNAFKFNLMEISANSVNAGFNLDLNTIFFGNSVAALQWHDFASDLGNNFGFANLEAYTSGVSPNRSTTFFTQAYSESGGSGQATNAMYSYAGGKAGAILVQSNGADYSNVFQYLLGAGPGLMTGKLHYGDTVGYSLLATADAGLKTAYSRVIKANSLGTKGHFSLHIQLACHNTGATNVQFTASVVFGSTTVYSGSGFGATGTSTPRYGILDLWLEFTGRNSTSSQLIGISEMQTGAMTLGTGAVAGSSIQDLSASAEDTTTDLTLSVTAQLNTATNSVLELLGVEMLGPYYSS